MVLYYITQTHSTILTTPLAWHYTTLRPQTGLLNHFLRKNKRDLGRGRKPPFIADSSSLDVEVPSHDCSYTDAAQSFNGNIATVDVSHQYIFMLII